MQVEIPSKIMKVFIKFLYPRKLKEFDKYIEHPQETQERWLLGNIKKNSSSLFGKKHEFDKIKNVDVFPRMIPTFTYEKLKPYIELQKKYPKERIMSSEPVEWWCITSGTTERKYIPYTKSEIEMGRYMSSTIIFSFLEENPKNLKIFDGKIFGWAAPPPSNEKEINGVPVGFKTTITIETSPIRNVFFPPPNYQLIRDQSLKYWACAKLAVESNLTCAGAITSILARFFDKVKYEFRNKLIKISERYRSSIRNGEVDFEKLWPDLTFLILSGVKTGLYERFFEENFPNVKRRETYGATESNIAFQRGEDKALTVFVNLGYFEILPKGKNELIPLAYAKKNTIGKLYITSTVLYRWDMGDIIKLVKTDPIQIEFIDREDTINLAGEKTGIEHLSEALRYASKKEDAVPLWFGPRRMKELKSPRRARYYIAILFRKKPKKMKEFIKHIDFYLQETNPVYKDLRQDTLQAPVLKVVPTYKDLLEALGYPQQLKSKIIDDKIYMSLKGEEFFLEELNTK